MSDIYELLAISGSHKIYALVFSGQGSVFENIITLVYFFGPQVMFVNLHNSKITDRISKLNECPKL